MTTSGDGLSSNDVVCHINLAKGFRGGERQTNLLMRELASLGWRQRLVVRRNSELLQYTQDIDGLDVVQVSASPVAAAVAVRGSALAHAHEGRALYPAWISNWLTRTPYLLTRRVDNPFRKSFFRGRAYRQANAIVCVSSAIRDIVLAAYPEVNCPVIADAHADFRATDEQRQAIRDRFAGKTLLGHVGALVQKHKGQMTIIEAARCMQQTRPDIHFVLLGSGCDEQMMRNSAKGLPNVTFTGQVDNVADYLAAFDVFVFPSLMEGLGSTLLDAMNFGLPIVASNVGGIPEIVEHGANGLLIEPGRSEQLVSAVQRLLSDENLRSAMRANNRTKAALYTAAEMAKSYDELYRRILAGG